jgi:hypothetical protein
MDCLARARHTSPTEWIAVNDIDEWYVPEHIDDKLATSIPDFFAGLDRRIASVNIHDTYANGEPLIEAGGRQTPMPQLATMSHLKPPALEPWVMATKGIHRLHAVQDAWIHWADTFRAGLAKMKVSYDKGGPGVPRFIHNRFSFRSKPAFEEAVPVTKPLVTYLNDIWDERDAIVAGFESLHSKRRSNGLEDAGRRGASLHAVPLDSL